MRLAESFLPPSPKGNGFPAISFIQPHIIHFSYLTHMKKTLAAFLLGMALTTSGLTAQTQFRDIDFNEALQLSQTENKLIFIDFYTDWCGPCRKMSKEVFPQKHVGDFFNSQFVCLKLNAEKEGKELAQKFGVKAYPTFIIADQQGNVKVNIAGAFPADAFIAKIKNELNPDFTPERMKQRYESGERTPELIDAYAMSFMEKKNISKGYEIINGYFDSLTDEQKLSAANFFIYSRYTFRIDDPKFQFLVKNIKKVDAAKSEEAMDYVQKLYHSALSTYLSGYIFEEKKFNEADYQQIKKDIKSLKLDKKYPFTPVFDLIECYAKGDKKAFFELFKSKKGELDQKDYELVLLNATRLFPNSPELTPEVIRYIRTSLPELRGSSIMMLGRILMTLEKE